MLAVRAATYLGWVAQRLDEPGATERAARNRRDAALYAASKYAVVGLTETLRLEAGEDVHVAILAPGGIDTAMTAQLDNDDGERLIPPADVAEVVLDALIDRRDWIFTHPEYLDFLEARHAGIVADYRKIS